MTRHRSGFTLLELLVVITVLAVLGMILTMLLKLTLDTERAQASSFDRLAQTSRLADEFRADVARAETTLAIWQDLRANEQTLILSLKDKSQIVYQWKEGKLWRTLFEADDFTERVVPIDAKDVRPEFVRPTDTSRLVRLRLHRLGNGDVSPGQTLEVAAAIGGDVR